MKFSILLTVFILLAAAGLGWRNFERLGGVRSRHAVAKAAAARVGISSDIRDEKYLIRVDSRDRVSRAEVAKQYTAEMIGLIKKYPEWDFEKMDPADRAKLEELEEGASSFNAAQTGIFISEMQQATDLGERARKECVEGVITQLAKRDPKAALELLKALPDTMKTGGNAYYTLQTIYDQWAKTKPEQALQWVKSNEGKFPELINESSKKSLLIGMASADPRKAFQALSELGLQDAESSVQEIIRHAETEAGRIQVLNAMREHLRKIPDESARERMAELAMRSFGSAVAKQGFEAGTRWIAAAKLTPEEIDGLAESVEYQIKPGEQSKWVEWIGSQLPVEKADRKIQSIVSRWTKNDYIAAGTWLSTAPAGAAKNSAIRSYAEVVSKVEPETAAQWAMTLPPGNEREETLRGIHRNWPKQTPAGKAAAEAFAKQHGIGE